MATKEVPFANPLTEQPAQGDFVQGATPLPSGYVSTASGNIYRADYNRGAYVRADAKDLEREAPLDVASTGAPADTAQALNDGPVAAAAAGGEERKAIDASPANKAVDQSPQNK